MNAREDHGTDATSHESHEDVHEHPHDSSTSWASRIRHVVRPHSHDSADKVDSALESSQQGIRAVKISLVALGVTASLQIIVVVISGSVALLADTIHNLSDALTAVPLWIAFALSRRAATKRYTYGFGRAEDLAGMFVVAMIALSAVTAGWVAIDRLLNPQGISQVGWVMVAAVVGFAGNELVAVYRIRVGRRIGSAALVADGLHARTDGLTSLAVLAGAVGVALGFPRADPIVGLVITVAILFVLRSAARDVYRRLMDAVDPDMVENAEAVLAGTPGITAVRAVRMRWIGHQIHAEADLDIDGSMSLDDAHGLAHHAETRLIHALPRLTSVAVHAYPPHHGAATGRQST